MAADSTRIVNYSQPRDDVEQALDVVFVHGLGGDAILTWRSGEDTWLEWLADDFPEAAIWSLGYPADNTKWTSRGNGMSLPDRVHTLMNRLLDHGIGTRRTLFVCHSLGGLVVKQMLRKSLDLRIADLSLVADSTVAVAFLATPHSGSTLASFAGVFPLSRPTRATLALRAHCPHLKDLGDWYRQNAELMGISTSAYYESRRLKKWIRTVTVVNPTSADPGVTGCVAVAIDADHVTIAKPASRDADVYLGISRLISSKLREAVAAPPSNRIDVTEILSEAIKPPEALVQAIREIEALRDLDLLDPGEVSQAKLGIVKNFYGATGD